MKLPKRMIEALSKLGNAQFNYLADIECIEISFPCDSSRDDMFEGATVINELIKWSKEMWYESV